MNEMTHNIDENLITSFHENRQQFKIYLFKNHGKYTWGKKGMVKRHLKLAKIGFSNLNTCIHHSRDLVRMQILNQ